MTEEKLAQSIVFVFVTAVLLLVLYIKVYYIIERRDDCE